MKKLIPALLLLVSALSEKTVAQSMNLYEMDTIQTIEITFTQPDWDYQLDTSKAGAQGYVLAAQCVVNGVVFDSVGVKYKGNSSYSAMRVKNPFHIKLDYVHSGADYQGYNDLKLNNGFKDPSFVREVLSYRILRNYMHAPQANYAHVYVNGTFIGLYTNVEDVNNDFSATHFYSTGNAYFKCNPNYGAGGHSDLVYYGTDSTSYYNSYELQSASGWGELVDLCDTLSNYTITVSEILDVDRALWMLSFNDVTVNLDSYSGAIKQNYYLYRDDNGRFNPVIWDLNECFGAFNNSGSGPPLSVSQEQTLTPLLHSTESAWPLIFKLLGDARYKKMYIAHMRTLVEENFSGGDYVTWAVEHQTLVDSSVNADANKFFTYSDFVNGLTTSVVSMGTIPGISLLMDSRATYLAGTSELTAVPPTISSITLSDPAPAIGDTVFVTATISSPTYAHLGWRTDTWRRFTYVTMYDDGAHGDGSAADGVYGAAMPCTSGQIEYYLYAENANAGVFSPVRAEYEFYILNPTVTMLSPGAVVINEFMASNTTTVTDPDGGYADWIELYNNTSSDINLNGIYLTDDYTTPAKWAFPPDANIAANGFLIVWCDGNVTGSGLHADFKLSSGGEEIMMSYPGGNVLDSITFGAQTADISLERCPNGSGPFVAGTPHTYLSSNCVMGVSDAATAGDWMIYPNPTSGDITLAGNDRLHTVSVFSVTGQMVGNWSLNGDRQMNISFSDVPAGMYFVKVNESQVLKVVVSR